MSCRQSTSAPPPNGGVLVESAFIPRVGRRETGRGEVDGGGGRGWWTGGGLLHMKGVARPSLLDHCPVPGYPRPGRSWRYSQSDRQHRSILPRQLRASAWHQLSRHFFRSRHTLRDAGNPPPARSPSPRLRSPRLRGRSQRMQLVLAGTGWGNTSEGKCVYSALLTLDPLINAMRGQVVLR